MFRSALLLRDLLLAALLAGMVLAAPLARASDSGSLMPGFMGGKSAPSASEAETAEEAHDRVARLSDQEVRELLLRELDRKLEAESKAPPGWEQLARSVVGAADLLCGFFTRMLGDTMHVLEDTEATMAAYGAQTSMTAPVFWALIVMIFLLPILGEKAVSRLWPEPRPAEPVPPKQLMRAAVGIMRHRLLLGAAAFGLSYLAGYLLFGDNQMIWRAFNLTFAAMLIIRISRWCSQFFQMPEVPFARLTPVSDQWARFMVRQTTLVASIGAAAYLTFRFRVEAGMPEAAVTVSFWFTLALFTVIIYSIWRGRHAFAQMIMAGHAAPSLTWRRLALVWPWVAIVLAGFEWLVIQYFAATGRIEDASIGGIFLTLMIILFLPPMLNAVQPLVAWLLPVSGAAAENVDPVRLAKRLATRKPLERIGRVVVLLLILLVLAALWGISPLQLFSDQFGSDATRTLSDLFWTVASAFLILQLFDIWLGRLQAADEGGAAPQELELGEMGGQGGTRLATVLPLFRRTGHLVIGVSALMAGLSEIGVNIAPLIAGAGIIGLAVGFGAQTLVQDVVSGLFFLIDDAFRIGEYVDISGTMGTVEKISVRSLRLRHHRGPLHTVPYGQISKLTNYSRDWVIVKLKFRVPFNTDINTVKNIFKQIGKDLQAHEELGPDFIQPFKSQGVFDVDDSAIIVRGKFMSKPGKQFLIKREVYVRVQRAFEQSGIEFARRSVIVQVAGAPMAGESMEEAQRRAALAAAEAAIEEQQNAEFGEDEEFSMGGDGPDGR